MHVALPSLSNDTFSTQEHTALPFVNTRGQQTQPVKRGSALFSTGRRLDPQQVQLHLYSTNYNCLDGLLTFDPQSGRVLRESFFGT